LDLTAGLCTFAVSYRSTANGWRPKVLVLITSARTQQSRKKTGRISFHESLDGVRPSFRRDRRAGHLSGPVLAAQFGFLPGTLWILIGATLGGGVHDMIVLFSSVRRGGRRSAKW